ncbi:hypothetical protein SOV_31820 [Sporomusa ovata DSM 2662]|uniref:Uncharacterized protein n=1 Tax=Sporomusa ovata TaxID=2378 RepID=A0A0U1L209_9FIRM|nr:hypothetical protein SOV_5c02860 [Sporomusa ovata DSM 2662]CQR73692.1 hypothetical protein SpAn4DRAFT_0154 [Sporomusa ovata]
MIIAFLLVRIAKCLTGVIIQIVMKWIAGPIARRAPNAFGPEE